MENDIVKLVRMFATECKRSRQSQRLSVTTTVDKQTYEFIKSEADRQELSISQFIKLLIVAYRNKLEEYGK